MPSTGKQKLNRHQINCTVIETPDINWTVGETDNNSKDQTNTRGLSSLKAFRLNAAKTYSTIQLYHTFTHA